MQRLLFSANLGFLWADRPLPDAVYAAKAAGFDAIECHWPYDVDPDKIRSALHDTGLEMLGLNTSRGDVAAGENGLSALPGRKADARAAIDQAIGYAAEIGAAHIHVMAGIAEGAQAHATFCANLSYACQRAAPHRLTVVIEPLNRHDAPGYFLKTTEQACVLINDIGAPNLKLMFDCYHVERTEGDTVTRLTDLLPVIGHIQFAAVPDRGAPDHGDLSYDDVFSAIAALGYTRPLGAEYKTGGDTDATLGWLQAVRAGGPVAASGER